MMSVVLDVWPEALSLIFVGMAVTFGWMGLVFGPWGDA